MMNISTPNIDREISVLLQKIEATHHVQVIHAVESGSRAWGFPSEDSDYDIRFIYCHSPRWYISPFERKDTIELFADFDLDASGWDIGKCLALLYKGNCTLHEWLGSPIVYGSNSEKFLRLQQFARNEFNSASAFYHYMSLAKRKFLNNATSTNAKYFLYGLRAVLCAAYIVDHRSPPPVLFDPLVQQYLPPKEKHILTALLERKAQGQEMAHAPIDAALWTLATEMYKNLQSTQLQHKRQHTTEDYTALMQSLVTE